MHGTDDNVVDIEHAFRLKQMLDKYNKPYDWYLYENGKHSFTDNQQRQDAFNRIVEFLQKHI
jgi:dipeptidyl aminopeptidase/acylaminoacyl peptidase